MMLFVRRTWAGWTSATLLALAGCSIARTGDLSGSVTLDGAPVKMGAITFVPLDGTGPTKVGSIKDGLYFVRDVPSGPAKVIINGTIFAGERKLDDTPNSPMMNNVAELLPAKFNRETILRYDVITGPNVKNFDLLSK